jgi:uncharacterized protein (TIGR02001 family)
MNKLNLTLTGFLMLTCLGVGAEESSHEYSANGALSTDYLFRGQSQTGNNPAISGGFDYSYAPLGFYAGTWASNLNFGGNIELDWYGGFAGDFSGTGLVWDVGVLYYQYPGAADEDDLDYVEFHAGLSHSLGDLPGEPAAGFTIHYSPEWTGGNGESVFYDGNVEFSLPHDFALATHVGYQTVNDNLNWGTPDWMEWNVSLSRSFGPLNLSIAYIDTDLDKSECFGGDNICDGRAVFTISGSF